MMILLSAIHTIQVIGACILAFASYNEDMDNPLKPWEFLLLVLVPLSGIYVLYRRLKEL